MTRQNRPNGHARPVCNFPQDGTGIHRYWSLTVTTANGATMSVFARDDSSTNDDRGKVGLVPDAHRLERGAVIYPTEMRDLIQVAKRDCGRGIWLGGA